jgi:hypothetical protein
MVIGEFGCAGWNTNSFLRFFGGLNKGIRLADFLIVSLLFDDTSKETLYLRSFGRLYYLF